MTDVAWRLIDDLRPADGARNMAVDAALLDAVKAGAPPALRLYRWDPPTLSFGRNQPARGLYDESAAAERGIAFVRRPTGGQAVLHADELTYAVIAPVSAVGRPRAAYRRINEALVTALARLGVAASAAGGSEVQRKRADGTGPTGAGTDLDPPDAVRHDWTEACFRRPERGEVVVGGRKLVGSAQRTESRVILQHGSILLGGSQAPAEELLVERDAGAMAAAPVASSSGAGGPLAVETGWTTVADELAHRPPLSVIRDAVVAGFEAVVGVRLSEARLSEQEAAAADGWTVRFASADWTWRR